jgi:hypothetical protein
MPSDWNAKSKKEEFVDFCRITVAVNPAGGGIVGSSPTRGATEIMAGIAGLFYYGALGLHPPKPIHRTLLLRANRRYQKTPHPA